MFLKFNSWGPLDEYTGRGLNHVQHDQVVEVADDLGAALLKDFPNNWRASTAEAYATWLKTKPAPTQTTGRYPPARPSGAKKLETPEPVGGPKPGAVTPVGTSGTQPPAPPLKSDGPTLEEYVKAGHEPKTYPPHGYAPKAFKQKRMDDLQITFEKHKAADAKKNADGGSPTTEPTTEVPAPPGDGAPAAPAGEPAPDPNKEPTP